MRKICKVVAEVGCNHMGNVYLAETMIKLAAKCGADVVKFQKRCVFECLSEGQRVARHPVGSCRFGESYGEHRENLELSVAEHKMLMYWCDKYKVEYSCSVWDPTSAKEISSLNPKHIKIPSPTNQWKEVYKSLVPDWDGKLHVSLGMSTLGEITNVLTYLKELDRRDVVLYACTSGYPLEPGETFLKEITRLIDYPGVVPYEVGYSGHHKGTHLDIAAMTLGATWLERHFTISQQLRGTDHQASLEPKELSVLCYYSRVLGDALQFKEGLAPVEIEQRAKLRR